TARGATGRSGRIPSCTGYYAPAGRTRPFLTSLEWRNRPGTFKMKDVCPRGWNRVPRLSRRKLLKSAVQGAAGLSLGIMGLGGAHRAGAQQGDRSGPRLASGFHVLSAGDTNVLAVS